MLGKMVSVTHEMAYVEMVYVEMAYVETSAPTQSWLAPSPFLGDRGLGFGTGIGDGILASRFRVLESP